MPGQHISDLRKLFERLRKYRLRELLGFIVNERGIELDLDKVRAIRNMPAPKIETEVKGFLGRQYLESPPVLVPVVPDKPLIIYLTVLKESMGGILGQRDDSRKEQAIYYLSKKFIDCEQRYSTLE
ncbi:hypothetical protein CR513_16324, partial [Mucuna pruriens]